MTSYDRTKRFPIETNSGSLIETLEVRLNYIDRLYSASRREYDLERSLQIGFRANLERHLTPEDRAELLRYIKFKIRNYEIENNKIKIKRLEGLKDYFLMNFM